MSKEINSTVDGMVLYTDGSFRRGLAGWGVHGYTYTNVAMRTGIGQKQVPTNQGYEEVPLTESVTVQEYFDGFGSVTKDPTNNTAELMGVINGFKIAETTDAKDLLLMMDSEYVRKGLTSHIHKWIKNGWVKADGAPVANRGYWETLSAAQSAWLDAGRKVELRWVKGHSGNHGNEAADTNALMGSATTAPDCVGRRLGEGYHKVTVESNPLLMKTRLIWSFGPDCLPQGNYYHTYSLGRMHSYGHKPGMTPKEKMAMLDLIYGRRISEATYCVYKATEPDEFIDELCRMHQQAYQKDINEIGVLRLDNAYRPGIYSKLQQLGARSLVQYEDIQALVTPHDDLVSKTLYPPRLAYEGIQQFTVLRTRLDSYLAGTLGEGTQAIDVTTSFYGDEVTGKKTKTKLHKTITNTTPTIEVPVVINGVNVTLKVVLGLDIPQRNQLAKLADFEPKVTVLVVADGPVSYSFSAVFETNNGSAIYSSPYTKFVLPKTKG